MPRRVALSLMIFLATLGLAALAEAASAAVPAWTTYWHDRARSGIDPDSAQPVTPAQVWQTKELDGEIYGQPLVYGLHVYVATENDTIYELSSATGATLWSRHLATPEASSAAPCGNISPSIGITSTPVIDPSTNRLYAVGAVVRSGAVEHELFALDLNSGRLVPGFPIAVDPAYPDGGMAVNQLQRTGLAFDRGRILIGYGGNAGDCGTYWGWLVSAPASGRGPLRSFQVDRDYNAGAIWASGNAPAIDPAGDALIATGNGMGNSTADPEYGDAVVRLGPLAGVLGWWAPVNWQGLDGSDADLGSGMPTLLPGGYLAQAGKDGNLYLLRSASLGHVSSPVGQLSGYCSGGSWGGSVYEPANRTLYTACSSGLAAARLGTGQLTPLTSRAGFSAPSGATGPPMIAGGLVWVADSFGGSLFGLDMATGATRSQFSIPENGSGVNHFSLPSAGGGRLFVASGDQVTAYRIAQAPPRSATATSLHASANPARVGTPIILTARVTPTPDAGSVSFWRDGRVMRGCSRVAVSAVTRGRATCRKTFTTPGNRHLTATYTGDGFYLGSRSPVLRESVVR